MYRKELLDHERRVMEKCSESRPYIEFAVENRELYIEWLNKRVQEIIDEV